MSRVSLFCPPTALMNLADIYCHHPGPSPEFIGDSLVQGRNPKPAVRGEDMKLKGGKPSFVLMRIGKHMRNFDDGNDDFNSKAAVFDLVLMDGSFVCFPARLNSGLSHKVQGVKIHPGACFTVLDYQMVWLKANSQSQEERRMVMVINDFTWKEAPAIDPHKDPEVVASDRWFQEEEFVKGRYDMRVVEECHRCKEIQFFNYCCSDTNGWIWTFLREEGIREGYFLHTDENKRLWKALLQEKKRKYKALFNDTSSDDEQCDCVTKCNLSKCVLEIHPVSYVCRKNLYEQVHDRLGSRISGGSFDEFVASHKRWSLYWHYAINVFGLAGIGQRRKLLPDCFVEYVRRMHPNPRGVCYTGHKNV